MTAEPGGRTLARLINARAREVQAEANLESSRLATRRFEEGVARRDLVPNILADARAAREVEVFEIARILHDNAQRAHPQS